eukprot:4649181-Pyramimonas_sp.AAC.1
MQRKAWPATAGAASCVGVQLRHARGFLDVGGLVDGVTSQTTTQREDAATTVRLRRHWHDHNSDHHMTSGGRRTAFDLTSVVAIQEG